MKENISILALSDVHIGCPRLNPKLLHQKFEKYVYPRITSDIDILFICGDFFDNLLNLNAFATFQAMEIIRELKDICRNENCDLRVLRGTFTHDRNQPRHFVNGEDTTDKSVLLYEQMSIEHHQSTGLNILYMPDNLVSDDIYADIEKLLSDHGLEKVDILIHHGYFKHMLPEALIVKGLPHGCLESEKIKKYVSGCVLNGHVHTRSVYQNIISVGSFDRLAYGEEDPKGFYQINIDKGVYKFDFIENEDANEFLTFDLQSYSSEDALRYFTDRWLHVAEVGNEFPEQQIHVRIVSGDKAVIEGCAQIAKSKFSNVIIDHLSTAKREQTIENIQTDLSDLPIITESNLCELLVPIVKKTNPNMTKESISKILDSISNKHDKG